MNCNARCGIAALSLFLVSTTAAANMDAHLQEVVDAGNRAVAHISDRLRPHLNPQNRDLADPGRITVVVMANFSAWIDPQARRVTIPAQLVAENLLQVQGGLLVQRYPGNKQLLMKYAEWSEYLVRRSYEAKLKAIKSGSKTDSIPVETFWSYAGLKAGPVMTPQEVDIQNRMMIDGLALVVAHELGHLALNHQDSRKIPAAQSRQQEHAADEFAANLLRAAGMPVLPGLMLTYTRFAMTEGLYDRLSPSAATHPSADCRIYRIGMRELDEIASSKKARDDFHRGSQMSIDQIRAFVNSKSC
jgi:hypothetical protein